MFFCAEFRADEDYLPAGTEILLIILIVMNLLQGLGGGTIEFKLEDVNVFLRLDHSFNATDAPLLEAENCSFQIFSKYL